MVAAIPELLAGIRRYLQRDLWVTDAAPRGGLRSFATGLVRLVVVLGRALTDPQLNLEATALVYRTLLSIVPLLAVGFSVLKAFGAEYKIEAVVARMLEPLGASGAQLASQVVVFVDNLQVSVLGAIGFVLLFYTVLSVIERIESALNRIWHVRRPRSLARKFSDYLSILLVGPVLVFGAFAIMAAAQNYWLVQRVLAATHLTEASVFVARHGAPFVLLVAAFTLLYRLLPHTRVTLRAALVGGTTADAALACGRLRLRDVRRRLHELHGHLLRCGRVPHLADLAPAGVAHRADRRSGGLRVSAPDRLGHRTRSSEPAAARTDRARSARRNHAALSARRGAFAA